MEEKQGLYKFLTQTHVVCFANGSQFQTAKPASVDIPVPAAVRVILAVKKNVWVTADDQFIRVYDMVN